MLSPRVQTGVTAECMARPPSPPRPHGSSARSMKVPPSQSRPRPFMRSLAHAGVHHRPRAVCPQLHSGAPKPKSPHCGTMVSPSVLGSNMSLQVSYSVGPRAALAPDDCSATRRTQQLRVWWVTAQAQRSLCVMRPLGAQSPGAERRLRILADMRSGWIAVRDGFSRFGASASGVSDGIQGLGSALSLSLLAGPAVVLGRVSSGPFPEAVLGEKGWRDRLMMAASFSRKPPSGSAPLVLLHMPGHPPPASHLPSSARASSFCPEVYPGLPHAHSGRHLWKEAAAVGVLDVIPGSVERSGWCSLRPRCVFSR